ncbi:MAG: FHA domain-containing protein [Gemmatimonadales bacterium]
MEAVAFVEVLDRRGRVRARYPVAQLPAGIGRAYDNAVILDDRWVSPFHARLDRDAMGCLILEDAGSENGLFRIGRRERIDRLEVTPGLVVRLGHTTLRIIDPTQPVPPALRDGVRLPGLDGWLETIPVAVIATALAALAIGWRAWTSHADDPGNGVMLGATLGSLLMMALWAGAWSLAGRFSSSGGRFPGHLTVVASAIFLFLVASGAGEYIRFLWPASGVPDLIALGLAVGLLAALLAGHLLLNTQLRRRRLALISVGLAVTVITLAVLAQDDPGAGADPGFSATLKPLSARVIPAEGADHFFDGLRGLKAQVDSLASDGE